MKKIALLIGVGIGFFLGSRAGRRPYEELGAKLRGAARRPEVHDVVEQARSTVKEQAASAAEAVSDKLPGSGHNPGNDGSWGSIEEPATRPI
jgi:hypothetical protein